MAVLSALVEDARQRYIEVSKPHVTIYIADSVGGSSASRMMAALSSRHPRTVQVLRLSSHLLNFFLLYLFLSSRVMDLWDSRGRM
jgi:hypothetical protein